VLSARAGDKDAFAVLVVRHQKMVLALVKRMLVNHPAMAADVVQEAAVTALIALERLRSPERFGAWYAGIALNVARGWLRGNRAAFPLSVDLPDGARGPDELAEAAEMAEGSKEPSKVSPGANAKRFSPSTGRASATPKPLPNWPSAPELSNLAYTKPGPHSRRSSPCTPDQKRSPYPCLIQRMKPCGLK
jgi:hypothetical protein